MKDYYAILESKPNDKLEDIKKKFHILAHKFHPDKGGDIKKMQEVNEAWAWIQKNHGQPVQLSQNPFVRWQQQEHPYTWTFYDEYFRGGTNI